MNIFKFTADLLVHKMKANTSAKPAGLLEFKIHILDDNKYLPDFTIIEKMRSGLLKNKEQVSTVDFGAGSRIHAPERTVGKITHTASVTPKFGRLLYRMANQYRPARIIELGTATGISCMYLASGCRDAEVYTVEGNPQLAKIASDNFIQAGLKNVTVINRTFENAIPQLLPDIPAGSIVFIDGNHTGEALQRYFSVFKQQMDSNSILIFDDINWSSGMQLAWKKIRQQASEGIFIDLFFMGIYISDSPSPAQFIRFSY